ncbi:MAG: carboxypeptidase-like regulatory domain-containing protein [Armatimonadetes bacterium]|nr:carboxypeptidase-like regulatory domain-containing protein [Armatimonadota bacterium]MDW8121137.1 carboxypeptidase regulatory-like domain-containing protein [Armatimonadota bacterium]
MRKADCCFWALVFLGLLLVSVQILAIEERTILRVLFLSESGKPLTQAPVRTEFFAAGQTSGTVISLPGTTGSSGEWIAAVPEGKNLAALVCSGPDGFYIPFEPSQGPVRSVTLSPQDVPSVICRIVAADGQVSLPVFVQVRSGPWVRGPEPKDGFVRLFHLPDGEHRLCIGHPWLSHWREGSLALVGPVTFRTRSNQTELLSLTVPTTQSLTVIVEDNQQKPVPMVSVILEGRKRGSLLQETDGRGRTRFEFLPRGTYRIQVLSPDYEAASAETTIDDVPVELKIVVKPKPMGRIVGKIQDDTNRIGIQGRIFVYRLEKGQPAQAVALLPVQSDGSFRGTLLPGSYLLVVQSGALKDSRTVTVAAHQEVHTGVWKLPRPAIVEGKVEPMEWARRCRIVAFANDPIPGDYEGFPVSETGTLPDGSFLLSVPPGAVTITVRVNGAGSPFQRSMKLTSGQRVRWTIRLPAPGSVAGVVTDRQSGQPIPFATVTLQDRTGNTVATVRAGGDGVYRFGLVFPGEYSVRCQAPGFATAVRHRLQVREKQESLADFLLGQGGTIVGLVVPPPDPVQRLFVLVDADTTTATVVQRDGSFRVDHIAPGRRIVMVFQGSQQVGGAECLVKERASTFVIVPKWDGR